MQRAHASRSSAFGPPCPCICHVRTVTGANSNELVQTRKKYMLLRALGAQPRRSKPAFVTYDNEAILCDTAPLHNDIAGFRATTRP